MNFEVPWFGDSASEMEPEGEVEFRGLMLANRSSPLMGELESLKSDELELSGESTLVEDKRSSPSLRGEEKGSESRMERYLCLGLDPLLVPDPCFFLFSFVRRTAFGVLDLILKERRDPESKEIPSRSS